MAVTALASNATPSVMVTRARSLRRDMTMGERKLWSEQRQFKRPHGRHVRKQAPIGPYIADFAIHSAGLVIEVDGEHHFEPGQLVQDQRRDAWLKRQGYKVLRFTTGDLEEAFEGCIEEIMRGAGLL